MMNKEYAMKPHDELPSQAIYPKAVNDAYTNLVEKLDEVEMEYLEYLMENIYKVAYTDGVKDTLYFHNLI